MDMQVYVDEMKMQLGGDVLDLELSDAQFEKIALSALRQMQSHMHSAKFVTVDFAGCIDTKDLKISEVEHVYVGDPNYGTTDGGVSYGSVTSDPLYMQAFTFNNGNISTLSNYMNSYVSYAYANQAMNSLGFKQLDYIFNKQSEKLYINCRVNCAKITIEYVPRFDAVEDVVDEFWIDKLRKYCIANAKIVLGRIRSRYTPTGGLWLQDGKELLAEGQKELEAVEAYLKESAGGLRPST